MISFEELVKYARITGFVYQGSEIYGGLANTWDYGPIGSLLKQNIKRAWINKFQRETPNNVLIDSSILLNTKVWEASGHLKNFSDPLMECRACNMRFRADKLIEEHANMNVDGFTNDQMFDVITNKQIKCPNCGKFSWAPIRAFNMMFETYQGVVKETASQIYLRPETAQGIFINFKNVQRTSRKKIPFGIAQVGKSFRNEITPGNFIFRTREFEQMELQYFLKPGTELESFKSWKEFCKNWLLDLGLKNDNIRFDDHKPEALSHYSNATTDIQYKFPWGFDELWGIASRTNFDLTSHQNHSGVDMTYLDPETNERYIPYVIEPSVGVERLFLAFLNDAYQIEELENGTTRELLKIHPFLAPYKAAVLPLMKKDHSEKATEVYNMLSKYFDVVYDDTQNIGKRYRRQDQIGTYLSITIDHETMENDTVTVRNRDTMEQIRLNISELRAYIEDKIQF
ncbi:glycine--tRNA ligase [Haploplasma modicum]|jgi:glycyl-tRNA synthetase|uniref:glycine--tRNA ligase n=1 Tax=Haploplasma modicum TaxID=2150 RepID=UPI00047ACEF9|nr:glycine--tRNA ligase [Haploplasma modicum]MCR1809020.1 glycine--tRNA ligase [Haploplasma modicum]